MHTHAMQIFAEGLYSGICSEFWPCLSRVIDSSVGAS
jgi:hypothetical protein